MFSENLGRGILNYYMTLILIIDITMKNSISDLLDKMGIDIVFNIGDFQIFNCEATARYLKNIKVLNLDREAT